MLRMFGFKLVKEKPARLDGGRKDWRTADPYQVMVMFERSHSDDLQMAREQFPELTDSGALMAQFVGEMQEAYDCGHLAGHFNVVNIREETSGV